MEFVYEPKGAEKRVWPLTPGSMPSAEAEDVERVTDWTYQRVFDKVMEGSAIARRALLWVLLKRDQPSLRFSDVSFDTEEVWWQFDAEERNNMRRRLDDDEIDEETRARLEVYLDEFPDDPPLVDADPKAEPVEPGTTPTDAPNT